MNCPQCGTDLPDDARFCRSCGANIAGPPAPPEPDRLEPAAEPPVTQPMPVAAPVPDRPPIPGAAPPPGIAGPPPQQSYAPPPTPASGYAPHAYAAPPAYAPQPAYAPGPAQPVAKRHTGLIVGAAISAVVLLGACGVVAFLLWPKSPTPPTPAAVTTSTVATTATPKPATSQADNTAAEQAVVAWYETIDAGDYAKLLTMVAPDVASGLDKGAFEGWEPSTKFEVARSAVDGDTAYVYGRESVRAFGSDTNGVKYTLTRGQGGTWLISAWNAVDEATVNGVQASPGQGTGAAVFDGASAKDAVKQLLEARRAGDAEKVRKLTTAAFQKTNGAVWLDGIATKPYFTAYRFLSTTKSGAAFVVKVSEEWNSGTETGTYKVVEQGGAILVDTWDSQ